VVKTNIILQLQSANQICNLKASDPNTDKLLTDTEEYEDNAKWCHPVSFPTQILLAGPPPQTASQDQLLFGFSYILADMYMLPTQKN
jgi:hypothetical protein